MLFVYIQFNCNLITWLNTGSMQNVYKTRSVSSPAVHFINMDGVSVRNVLFYKRQNSLKLIGGKGG